MRHERKLRKLQNCQILANIRCDFLHKIYTTIAKTNGIMVIEHLKGKKMSLSASGSFVGASKDRQSLVSD
jgi:putative transposase